MLQLKDAEKPQHAENRRVEVHTRQIEHGLDVPVRRPLRRRDGYQVSGIGYNNILGAGYTASILSILPKKLQ